MFLSIFKELKSYIYRKELFIIVIAQFLCTNLWFVGNVILPSVSTEFSLSSSAIASLTSAVQLGFILGTLIFAIFTISDRFSPSRVFFVVAVIGSLINLLVSCFQHTESTLFLIRAATGFCLAGIYPVGMKIAADYFPKGLGKALGLLVGALVLGTAFPFLFQINTRIPWRIVVYLGSLFCAIGGVLILLFIPDGPYRKPGKRLDFRAIPKIFSNRSFRGAAFGYFGHMWELYIFWAFLPVFVVHHKYFLSSNVNTSAISFFVITASGIGCLLSGYIADRFGTRKFALTALGISGLCCLLSPMSLSLPVWMFAIFLLVWGVSVSADSPQFSTMVAYYTADELKGTALTIVNSIGFSITILSLYLLNEMAQQLPVKWLFVFLSAGPIFGCVMLLRNALKN